MKNCLLIKADTYIACKGIKILKQQKLNTAQLRVDTCTEVQENTTKVLTFRFPGSSAYTQATDSRIATQSQHSFSIKKIIY